MHTDLRPLALYSSLVCTRVNALICSLSSARGTLSWTPVTRHFPLIQYWHRESNGRSTVDYFYYVNHVALCKPTSRFVEIKRVETSGADGRVRSRREDVQRLPFKLKRNALYCRWMLNVDFININGTLNGIKLLIFWILLSSFSVHISALFTRKGKISNKP